MTSKTKALLISTCVPIALLAYYCWLTKKKRSRRLRESGVDISDILAVIDKESLSKDEATRDVSWTVQNSTRVRLRRTIVSEKESNVRVVVPSSAEEKGEKGEIIDPQPDVGSRLLMAAEMNIEVNRLPEVPAKPVDVDEVGVEVVADDHRDRDPHPLGADSGYEEAHDRDSATHSPSRDLAGTPHDHCAAGFSDNSSEISTDSGKGGSEIANLNSLTSEALDSAAVQPITLYEFELAQPLVGLLIGKYGCNVHEIRDKCGAHVVVRKHPCNYRMKLITVEGTSQQIEEALVMIRRRFPPKRFPEVTLSAVNYLSCHIPLLGAPQSVIVPATFQLHLPASVMFDAYVSAVVSGGQLFLQQPTHPTYPSLKLMDQCMNECYADSSCPGLPGVDYGMVCAAPAEGSWYRAQVVSAENEHKQVSVKFLDYGGYADLPSSCLRQIRLDFMSLPFQAAECYLANIIPANSDGENGETEMWQAESALELQNLCSGVVLQAEALGFTVEGVSVVNLYRVMEDGSLMSINREMVNRGHARWMEQPEEAGYSMEMGMGSGSGVGMGGLDMGSPAETEGHEDSGRNASSAAKEGGGDHGASRRSQKKGKSKKKNRAGNSYGYGNNNNNNAGSRNNNNVDDAAKLVKDLSLEAN